MAKKYQIFISSTYEDLKEERSNVMKAILEMGHIPVGMEMFSAADEEQWKTITRQIDECDYYVVIVAHRYGSVVDNKSYTEKEYDYAEQLGVPSIAFIIDDGANWPGNKSDNDPTKKTALDQFKEKLRNKLVGSWNNKDDLYGQVAISLMKLFNSSPRPGWVPATEVAGPEIIKELTRLSEENSKLRKELNQFQNEKDKKNMNEISSIIQILYKNHHAVSLGFQDSDTWESHTEITHYAFFYYIAPIIMVEGTSQRIAQLIATYLKDDSSRKLRKEWPIANNRVNSLLVDLQSLGIVKPSNRNHVPSDTKDYWTLTEKGQDIYLHIRRQKLERGVRTSTPSIEEEDSNEN